MRNNYQFLRNAVIEEGLWTFATVRYISSSADKDDWGTDYIHEVPPDWLTVMRVYKDVSSHNKANWEQAYWQLESDGIHSAESMLYLYGVVEVTDTSKFTELFSQALAARIAADAAIPLTENRLLQADMWQLYSQKLDIAFGVDGKQGRMDRNRARSLERAR